MSSPTDRKVFEITVRTTPFLLPACLWRKTNPSTPLSTLPWLHSLHQPILLPCLPITISAMWTVLHLQHLLPRMISIPPVHLQSLVDRLALDYVRGREWTMYSWTMVSTANPILLIPPHHQHHQQQSHRQINLRKKRKMMNANQSSDTSSEFISIGEQYITDEWIADKTDCPMPTSKPLLNALRAIYFSKAIWPSHIFPSLSTLTLILKRKSSKQRSLANPRQIMRMSCSWCVERARCTKWWMKCYSMMSVDLLVMSI